MKKIFTILAVAAMIAVPARADEGMWLLPLMEKMNISAMHADGFHLTADQVYSINHSSLKDAIVHFGGGCTGEIISDQGLLVTNHHCGYGHIQALSTPEHNYLEDGYFAKDRSQELPAPGLSVTFLISMTDVTAELQACREKALKENRKKDNAAELAEKAVDELRTKLEQDAVKANPNCSARVTPFYNTNVYYLIVNKTYTDVRFVGAPPASMGKFGGETDNWMWPRHTCDFSMFRVYAGADNEPAKYSPDNKPYTPAQSLKISLKGVEEGDYAMIMGYPGRTQRFQTAAQLKSMIELNDIAIAARTVRQDVMWEARMADPVVNLQYASKYAGSANGWKKWIGMKQAFANLDIIGREEQKEAEYTRWINAKKKRQEAYGGAIEEIQAATEKQLEPMKAVYLLSESVSRIELVNFASTMARGVRMAGRSGDKAKLAESVERGKKAVMANYKDYSLALDRKEAEALISFYVANAKPENLFSVDGHELGNVKEMVDWLFDGSAFVNEEKLKTLTTAEQVEADPAVKFADAMQAAVMKHYTSAGMGRSGSTASAAQRYTAGIMEWKKGEPSYPDANSTMRFTYGNVKAYSPKDGVLYRHYTTLKGVMEKEDPENYEFRVPAGVKDIFNSRDYGQYANAAGELPTCFLCNCDITGGNSGSPVLNADGELIGLAFDGNWESMSSDVMFEPDLQRCICVDIRYVLLMMDKYAGAGYLLDEMKLVR